MDRLFLVESAEVMATTFIHVAPEKAKVGAISLMPYHSHDACRLAATTLSLLHDHLSFGFALTGAGQG